MTRARARGIGAAAARRTPRRRCHPLGAEGDSFERKMRPAPPCTALVRVVDRELRPALPCHRSCSHRSGGAKETRSIARRAPPLPPLLIVSPRQREGHSFDRELRPRPPATALVRVAGRVTFDCALRPPRGDLFDFVTRLITSCDGRGRGERAGGSKQVVVDVRCDGDASQCVDMSMPYPSIASWNIETYDGSTSRSARTINPYATLDGDIEYRTTS